MITGGWYHQNTEQQQFGSNPPLVLIFGNTFEILVKGGGAGGKGGGQG